jgi:hypothetical protein
VSGCEAEMCQYWTGQGCICEVLGLESDEHQEEDE